MFRIILAVFAAAFVIGNGLAADFKIITAPQPAPIAPAITDLQIRHLACQANRDAYYRTGKACACPEDYARDGSRCGGRSAYSRSARVCCYAEQVTQEDIDRYRQLLNQ